MKKPVKSKKFIAAVVAVLAVALLALLSFYPASTPNASACSKTATLVYATWCGHCQNELNMLGQHPNVRQSIKLIDIDSPAAVPYKQQYGVSAVPFWIWNDGTTSVGEKSYSELASLLGCKA